jgi:hypothetical protein
MGKKPRIEYDGAIYVLYKEETIENLSLSGKKIRSFC